MPAARQLSGKWTRTASVALLLAALTGCQSGPHAHLAQRPPVRGEAALARLTAPMERAAGVGLSVAQAATAIALFP